MPGLLVLSLFGLLALFALARAPIVRSHPIPLVGVFSALAAFSALVLASRRYRSEEQTEDLLWSMASDVIAVLLGGVVLAYALGLELSRREARASKEELAMLRGTALRILWFEAHRTLGLLVHIVGEKDAPVVVADGWHDDDALTPVMRRLVLVWRREEAWECPFSLAHCGAMVQAQAEAVERLRREAMDAKLYDIVQGGGYLVRLLEALARTLQTPAARLDLTAANDALYGIIYALAVMVRDGRELSAAEDRESNGS